VILGKSTDIRAARDLPNTTNPVELIADQVGYTSEAAFSRAFRKRYWNTPRALEPRSTNVLMVNSTCDSTFVGLL
jgi:AraC-like DNA-binding protein